MGEALIRGSGLRPSKGGQDGDRVAGEEPVVGGGGCSFSHDNKIHGWGKDHFQGSIHCRLIRDPVCFGELAIAQAKAKTCMVSSN